MTINSKSVQILNGDAGYASPFGSLAKELAFGTWLQNLETSVLGVTDGSFALTTIDLSAAATGVANVSLADNLAAAWTIKEGSNEYLRFVTTDSSESIAAKQRLTTTDGVSSGTARIVGGAALVDPAASTAITGTTETQSNFDHGSYTVPANTLKVGTVVRIKAGGRYTATTGTENHTLGVAFGGTNLCVTGNIDPATNDVFDIEFTFTCRAAGGSGTVVGTGRAVSGTPASSTLVTHVLATGSAGTSTTSIDTTASAALAIFVDRQATATDSDSMRLDYFIVDIVG